MMVVIVVSRRVGQVTLAVSERTSCKNLNGLKAIVLIRVRRQTNYCLKGNRTALLTQVSLAQASFGPTLSRRMSRQAGSIVRGFQKPRRISAFETGRLQVAAMYCRISQRSR